MLVGFFAEMKMRGEGVLEKMYEEVAAEDQKENRVGAGVETRRGIAAKLQRFGNHFEQCGGQHEAGAERDEIMQIAARPFAMGDERAAQNVSARGSQA